MSVQAIGGLVLLNLFLLASGCGLLYGLRGWRGWGEVGRLAGLAYLLGVATVFGLLVLELVVHVPFSLATVLLTGAAIGGGGIAVGRMRGHPLPPPPRRIAPLPALTPVAAVLSAATLVYLEALFRAGRLAPLTEFDPWSFWVPKAKAIYFFGGFEPRFWNELPNSSYPPLLPTLEATAFRFMGSADTVTLHLQFWFLAAGFVAAVVGLVPRRVPAVLRWSPLLLVLGTPHVVGHLLQPQADFLLDELFAVAALLVARWLLEREAWLLAAAGPLVAALVLTKRDGYLLAACLLVAALAVSVRAGGGAWRPLLAVAALVVAAVVPWRIVLATRGLGGGAPPEGATGLVHHLDRGWPALRLTLTTLFDYHVWLVVTPVALVAIAVAALAGAGRLAAFAGLVWVLAAAGFTWVSWSYTDIPITEDLAINPIIRLTGALALLAAALVPLLLDAAWRGDPEAVPA